jgi:gamma-glutamyl phosphate reductase
MALITKTAGTAFLAIGLGLVGPAVAPFTAAATAQSTRYDDARRVIDRTQNDLQSASGILQKNNKKDLERVRNAQKSLTEVDRSFSKGKFNKDRLDSAIDDLQHVLDHNTLQGHDRDMLMQDVTDLRAIRSNKG